MALGFEELEPRRLVAEKPLYRDGGAFGRAGRFWRAGGHPLVDGVLDSGRLSGAAGQASEPGHRGNAGQSLAAKAECGEAQQVIGDAQFGCGVPAEGGNNLVSVDAVSVVHNLDERGGAAAYGDLDRIGAGVDGVFDQFLDH